ncbi:MAG: hypothetical protein AAFX85_11820, partial [Pseudomonadota bacterium]
MQASRTILALCALGLTASALADVPARSDIEPVLLVISNQDFYYREYADTRSSLEVQGLDVVVAAATIEVARPHAGPGAPVHPDLSLAEVSADDYSGIVFAGGWGMAQYQYGFEGTYHNSAYRPTPELSLTMHRVINEFVEADRPIGAISNGVSVLAYARVDGVSLLKG